MSEETQLMHVPLDQLHPDPDQPRKEFVEEDLQALAQSIRQHGIISPLTVRENAGDGYIITAGGRRYAAARLAGLETAPVLVRGEDSPLVTAMIENLVRQDLSPIEEGLAYQALALPADEIANLVQRPEDRVEDRLSLARLPDEAKAMLLDKRLPLQGGRTLALFNEVDKAIAEKIAAMLADGTVDDIDSFVRSPAWTLKQVIAEIDHNRKLAKKLGWFGLPTGIYLSLDLLGLWFKKPTVKALEEAAGVDPGFKLPDYAGGPVPSIDGALVDQARAYGCLVETGEHRGGWVTDLEWLEANLPAAFPEQVQEHYARYKPGSSRPKASAKAQGDLSPAEQKKKDAEAEARAKEREKAAEERRSGEAFNLALGEALYGKLGKVDLTVAQARLVVKTIFQHHLAEYGYSGPAPRGLAMYHRFLFEPPERTKKGDAKHLRKQEALNAAMASVERELARAKNVGEVFAVLWRTIAAGLFTNLDGLAKVDLEGCTLLGLPFRDEWEEATKKVLPLGIRKKLADSK